MLRKFGFKKSEPRESEARLKLQKELFAYNRVSVRTSAGCKPAGVGHLVLFVGLTLVLPWAWPGICTLLTWGGQSLDRKSLVYLFRQFFI